VGRIPPPALIDLRRQGTLPELRASLSDGVESLVKSDPANFGQTLIVSNEQSDDAADPKREICLGRLV
jgi:hypothetical protein